MNAVSSLLSAAVVLAIIVGAVVYMFNPKAGGEILKRLGIVLLVLLLGIPFAVALVRELVQSLGTCWFLFLLLTASAVAYVYREVQAGRNRKPPGKPWGAERTPVLPTLSKEKDKSDGNDNGAVGAG